MEEDKLQSLSNLARDAFNLDVLRYQAEEEDKPSSTDPLGFTFWTRSLAEPLILRGTHSIIPPLGFLSLAERIEETFKRAALFFQGSAFVTPEQQALLRQTLGNGFLEGPLQWTFSSPRSGGHRHLTLSLRSARELARAGITIDLKSIFENHRAFHAISPGDWIQKESDDAVRAFCALAWPDRLQEVADRGLGESYRGASIFHIGATTNASNAFSMERGDLAVNAWRCACSAPEETRYDRLLFTLSLSSSYLHPHEVRAMMTDLRKRFKEAGAALRAQGKLVDEDPLGATTYHRHGSLSLPYATVEKLLKAGVRTDIADVLGPYLSLQKARLDACFKSFEEMRAALGVGWIDLGHAPEWALEAGFSDKSSSLSSFEISWERVFSVWGAQESRESVFDAPAQKLKTILEDAGLGEGDFEIRTRASRGMLCSDKDTFELRFTDLTQEKVARLAATLGKVADKTQPLLSEILGAAHLPWGQKDDKGHAARSLRRLRRELHVRAIESLRTGVPFKDLKIHSRCGGDAFTVEEMADYLAGSLQDENPRIRKIAARGLAEMASVSPLFARFAATPEGAGPKLGRPALLEARR